MLKNVEKVFNVMKNEMFDQSSIKTLKTIKCLTKVLSKHSKQSTLKTNVKDRAQSSRSKKERNFYYCHILITLIFNVVVFLKEGPIFNLQF